MGEASFKSSTALSVVDPEPLLREARIQHEKVLKRLNSAQRSLERFEESDIPAFEQWKAQQFGGLQSRLREATSELFELETLVHQVEAMHYFTGRRIATCYEKVMYWREHPEEARAERERAEREAEAERAAARNRHRESEGSGNAFEDDFENAFGRGFFGDEWDEDGDDGHFSGSGGSDDGFFGRSHPMSRPKTDRASKSLYRSLALKLHPDHRNEICGTQQRRLDELWHETREAYRLGDVEGLERIAALLDLEEGGLERVGDVGKIERATERHRESLRALERSVRQARTHAAWMFSKKKPAALQVLERFMLSTINAELVGTVRELSYLKGQVEQWETKRKRRAEQEGMRKSKRKGATKAEDSKSSKNRRASRMAAAR